ncbi:MAG: membrane integrity-associated transporter subunit PqiC [Pantoea sp. Brub]|nr:membrane integrity-associated transporter subunit PqiC [Pantoea sp. Brub]
MKKKQLIFFASLIMAVSCSDNIINNHYYQLSYDAQDSRLIKKINDINKKTHHIVLLKQIIIPDYLEGSGLVYQVNDVKYQVANNNLWATPLDQQLKKTMMFSLNNLLSGWLISDLPLTQHKQEENKLTIILTAFQGRYDGKAVISGEWILERANTIIRHPFNIIKSQKQDGYDELVRMLSIGWKELAKQIADILIK